MSDIIDLARRLKSDAMNARDGKDFPRAIQLIEQAEGELRGALDRLAAFREPTERPSRSEMEIASQLAYILGTKGGIFRRWGQFENSARAYDAGYQIERRESRYGIVNSYNMVQRLVARVYIQPAATQNDSAVVLDLPLLEELNKAREEVRRQRGGPRAKDEYAAADLALVCALLGDEGWKRAVSEFLNSSPAPGAYAVNVTLEEIEQLLGTLRENPLVPGDLKVRLAQIADELRRFASNRG